MENIISYYGKNFFELLSLFVAVVGIFIITSKKTKTKTEKSFFYYLLSYLSISILALFNIVFNPKADILVLALAQPLTDYLFTIFEFYIFSWILRPSIPKWIYEFGSLIFYTSCPILLYLGWPWHLKTNYFHLQFLYNIQAIILLVYTCFYFFSIFRSTSLYLINESIFWINSGLTFFLITTLPFTIISSYLLRSKTFVFFNLFNIIPVFYSVLFVFIIVGLKKEQIKSSMI